VGCARADGELVYANRTFVELIGTNARPDLRVGGYAEPYGVYTRDGTLYPEARMPFVRALAERRVIIADDITIRRRDGRQIDIRAVARRSGSDHACDRRVLRHRPRVTAERARAESELPASRRAQRFERSGRSPAALPTTSIT